MGLLDSVIGAMGQGGGQGGTQAQLVQAVLGMLAQGGGLEGLLQRLQQGGLGEAAASWVSTGQNLPVSPDRLGQALGQDAIEALGRHSGLQGGDLLGGLAQVLPHVVDRMTPGGTLPPPGTGAPDLGGLLGQVLGSLGR